MDEKIYLVGYTRPGDKFISIAKFGDISNAVIFTEAYFEKFYAEENLSLTIMRVERDEVIEHARDT